MTLNVEHMTVYDLALVGCQLLKEKLAEKEEAIHRAIESQRQASKPAPIAKQVKAAPPAANKPAKRKLTVSARKRMAEAQKRRWAAKRNEIKPGILGPEGEQLMTAGS